jgi:molybdate transport system substrate-binding protein
MNKIKSTIFLLIVLSFISILTERISAQITAACAANVKFALEEITAGFEKSTGTKVRLIYGASGLLAAQIKNGAPFDVFVSADTDFPDSLVVHGFADGKPGVYAYGTVVLWTAKNIDVTRGLEVLKSPDIGKIAIPDPKSAPYGRAAMQALRKAGLFNTVRDRLVFGESIAQTAQYIITQAVDIGFNAKGIVMSKAMKDKGHWIELDTVLCPKIAQAVVMCAYGHLNNPVESKRFLAFLESHAAKDIFKKAGYDVP